jgi:anti-sigma-K factor RskA
MDIQDYIASGIIESYVMGMATPREREEFERLCRHYPELEVARKQFEDSLETKAQADAETPPAFVKEKIFDAIRREQSENPLSISPADETTIPKRRRSTSIYWTVAACVILLAGCIGMIWFFYEKNQQLKSEMVRVEQHTDSLSQRKDVIEEQWERNKSRMRQVEYAYHQGNSSATMHVYWDSANADVYLVIKNLAVLPANQQYQVWAITDGKQKSLGLFDAPPPDESLILKMTDVQQADSFSITVEKSTGPLLLNDSLP